MITPKVILALAPLALLAEKPTPVLVEVLDRRDSETGYQHTLPAHAQTAARANSTCYVNGRYVDCSTTGNASTVIIPSRTIAYQVRGATLTLRLPDNRVVVVNCESKYSPKGDHINRRSCRTPSVGSFQAIFKGDKAKLIWLVSLDGKKMQSETYKVVAIHPAP